MAKKKDFLDINTNVAIAFALTMILLILTYIAFFK